MSLYRTQIDRIYRGLRTLLEGDLLWADPDQESDVRGLIGLAIFNHSVRHRQLRLVMPTNQHLRDLLLKALWGNPQAMKHLLKLVLEMSLKRDELRLVLRTLTHSGNAKQFYAMQLLQQIALQAPASVLDIIAHHVRRYCQQLGNHTSIELLSQRPSVLAEAKTPTPFPDPRRI